MFLVRRIDKAQGSRRSRRDRGHRDIQQGRHGMSEAIREVTKEATKGHIGIVGVSPEGAALFYRQLMRTASLLRGPETPLRE